MHKAVSSSLILCAMWMKSCDQFMVTITKTWINRATLGRVGLWSGSYWKPNRVLGTLHCFTQGQGLPHSCCWPGAEFSGTLDLGCSQEQYHSVSLPLQVTGWEATSGSCSPSGWIIPSLETQPPALKVLLGPWKALPFLVYWSKSGAKPSGKDFHHL
jgi:hypothetical protein